jgi:hypothetical protein
MWRQIILKREEDRMDIFEDMFKRKHNRGHHDHHDDHYYDHSDHRDIHYSNTNLTRHGLSRLIHNKIFLLSIAGIIIVIVIVIIMLIAAFMPLIYKLIAYINQNGLKGALDYVLPLVSKLWEGGGKP